MGELLKNKNCLQCGGVFNSPRKDAKYCGHKCRGVSSRKHVKHEFCVYCGNPNTGRSNYKYCSLQCANNNRITNKREDNCLYCHKELTGRHRQYCNSSCAAKRNNIGKVRNGTPARQNLCVICNASFKVWSGSKGRVVCSSKCHGLYLKLDNERKIENGEILSFQRMRDHLKINFNFCWQCGVYDTYNGKPIVIQCDHIDGDNKNNALSNLQLLCPNCHSQTDTWCGRNKNKKKLV